jgi:hypothetical protein
MEFAARRIAGSVGSTSIAFGDRWRQLAMDTQQLRGRIVGSPLTRAGGVVIT